MIHLANLIEYLQECQREIEKDGLYSAKVFVHYQYNWPLKARITNVKLMDDGSIAIAVADTGEYGSKEAWE